MVAREDAHPGNPQAAECSNRVPGAFADSVGNAEDADRFLVPVDYQRGRAPLLHLFQTGPQRGRQGGGTVAEIGTADLDEAAVQHGPDPKADLAQHVFGFNHGHLGVVGRLHHRFGQGMGAVLLRTGGAGDDLIPRQPLPGDDFIHPRLAEGEGAGFIEQDDVRLGHLLEMPTAFDENSGLGRPGHRRNRRGGGGHQQGAGAAGDQHGHGPASFA